VGHPNLRIIDLSLSCLIAELQDNFTYLFDPGRTDRVPACFKSPARVNRDLSAQGSFTIGGKFSCLSFPAESEVFNRTNLGNRETIVYFHHIDIFMGKFCQPECFLSCSNCCIKGRYIPVWSVMVSQHEHSQIFDGVSVISLARSNGAT
jgi:hypothetical protein